MKNKIAILVVALLTSAGAASVQAGHVPLRFGGGFGISAQFCAPPVHVVPRVFVEPVRVVCAPPPVYVTRLVLCAPVPVYVTPVPYHHRVPVYTARYEHGYHRGHHHGR